MPLTIQQLLLVPVGLAAATVAACAPYPLHSTMTDAEIRTTLATSFPTGMTLDEVRGELKVMRVPTSRQLLYPPEGTRPEVLLARLSPPGGFWLDGGDDELEWVDVSFIFDERHSMTTWVIFRDGIRYNCGDPINPPARRLMGYVPRWPGLPPPPIDPLEGAE